MNFGALLPMFMGDTEMAAETIENLVAQYKPIIYAILREGFQGYKDLVSNDDYFIQRAQMRRKMYSAYIDAGFTEEQAMAFLLDDDNTRAKIIKQLMSMVQAVN
ncbi:MAG: DUF1186 family protein [Oscillospiraceae bacterium]|jgi:hypothetical protein|nr:DUF1186 family protein [Oscillospiraceae bacterium]